MAKITELSITLTLLEAIAVYTALGAMCGSDYPGEEIADAGSNVYSELTRLVDDGDDE